MTRPGDERVYGRFAEGETFVGPAPASGPSAADPGRDTPATIPGYELFEELGRGGMAIVVRARQVSLDRVVALKIMAAELAGDPDFVRRFEREAKALAALSHPNITAVFDRGQAGERLFFAMEYVQGRTLRSVLQEAGGRLPAARTLGIMLQVASALEYVHGTGTVHRDIKPENVLLSPGDVAKVTDFGLAAMADRGPSTKLTGTGVAMGTFDYMSPEQRENARDADHRTDIWSFGVMLYELLVGTVPMGRWDVPSALDPGLDPRFDAVVLRCLEADREKRYPDMAGVRSDLAAIRDGAPLPTDGSAPEIRLDELDFDPDLDRSAGPARAGTRETPPRVPAPEPPADGPAGPEVASVPVPDPTRAAIPDLKPPPLRPRPGSPRPVVLDDDLAPGVPNLDPLGAHGSRPGGRASPVSAPSSAFVVRLLRAGRNLALATLLAIGGGVGAWLYFEPQLLVEALVRLPPATRDSPQAGPGSWGPRLWRAALGRARTLADTHPGRFGFALLSGETRRIKAALAILVRSREPQAAELVAAQLAHQDDEVFELAVKALEHMRIPAAEESLRTASRTMPEPRATTLRRALDRRRGTAAPGEEAAVPEE